MKADRLAINSQCTFQHNLEEALDAYASAGFRNVEPHLNLVKDWLDDGHTVDDTRRLFEERGLSVVASSQLEVMCFGSPDARHPNLRANAENARLIRELGADKMIVGTDGPEQVTPTSLDPIARALVDLAEATEEVGVDVAVEFNASPVVKEPQARDYGLYRSDGGERENPSPPAAAMEALRIAVACEVSRREGRPIKIAEIQDEPGGLS